MQQLAHLVARVGVELEPHGATEPPPAQFELDRSEEILGLFFLECEVGVAGDAEAVVVDDLHAGEELVEVCRDDLLEGNEALTVGQHHEARQQRRHLDAREAALRGDRDPARSPRG